MRRLIILLAACGSAPPAGPDAAPPPPIAPTANPSRDVVDTKLAFDVTAMTGVSQVTFAPSTTPGANLEIGDLQIDSVKVGGNDLMFAQRGATGAELDLGLPDIDEPTAVDIAYHYKAHEGFSLTHLAFISRAIIDALGEFPHLNASMGDGELIVHNYVDLGMAVDLDYQGLIVPVIRGADGKRLRAIAREIHDLAARARNRKLSPDEISGGTFTISNNGSAGSVLTAAIINQPQVAIVSTDAIKRRPVVVDLPGGGESIAIHSVGNLAMSWDHRAFDGVYAAHFLVKVKTILETRDWGAEL